MDLGEMWVYRYVGMIALNATVEGPRAEALEKVYTEHMDWVFENSEGPTVVKMQVAQFFNLVATNCQ